MYFEKKKLLISFSGGASSGYMTKLLLDYLDPREWEIAVVFANTGKEREETFQFILDCDRYFGFNTVWVEPVVNPIRGLGTTHKVVNYFTANREGVPFEEVILKYGLPNVVCKSCTRDIKIKPIHSYARNELGWKNYYTAVGIRADESNRTKKDWKGRGFIYPLVYLDVKRIEVNKYWHMQPFRLNLKSYEGNCDFCFEKSKNKLATLCKECPHETKWWIDIGKKYKFYVPDHRICKSENPSLGPFFMYRENRSLEYFIGLPEGSFIWSKDESVYEEGFIKTPPALVIENVGFVREFIAQLQLCA